MSIVKRLRALSRHEHDDLTIGDEAADEIDRLREALAEARSVLTYIYESPSMSSTRGAEAIAVVLSEINAALSGKLDYADFDARR